MKVKVLGFATYRWADDPIIDIEKNEDVADTLSASDGEDEWLRKHRDNLIERLVAKHRDKYIVEQA